MQVIEVPEDPSQPETPQPPQSTYAVGPDREGYETAPLPRDFQSMAICFTGLIHNYATQVNAANEKEHVVTRERLDQAAGSCLKRLLWRTSLRLGHISHDGTSVCLATETRTMPVAGISNVLSCEPYSSAFWAIRPTFETLPIVVTSNAPFSLQNSIVAW